MLLDRLYSLGVSGSVLQWMDSYMRGRSQSVVIDGVKSDPQDLQYDIPQRSVLGPILFTIYTIPIGTIARLHNLEIHIYADDTQLYVFFYDERPDFTAESSVYSSVLHRRDRGLDGHKQAAQK